MDVYCSYSACTPVTQRHAKSWKGKLFIVGPLWQMLWQNSKRPGARDGSPDFLLFVCSLRRSYLQCGERGRSALCVSVSWGSFSSKMFETSEENSERVSKHWKHSVCVRALWCSCMFFVAQWQTTHFCILVFTTSTFCTDDFIPSRSCAQPF